MLQDNFQSFIRYLLDNHFKQLIMVNVVKVLPKIQFKCISICAIASVMPEQMLLEASTREGYPFAFQACPIIMDHIALQDRNQ